MVTVTVAGLPGLTEAGLTEHWGASCGVGCTEQVKETEVVKPLTASMPTLDVELWPGLIGLGARPDAEMEKSGVRSKLAVTV